MQRAGKAIPEIFAQDGEPAFRALEAAVCGEMAAPAGLVIATGGGAVVNPANREALVAGGTVICLETDLETILRRVGQGDDRPMLASPDRVARIRELLAARAEAYAALPHHLDRTHLTIPATAERVMGIAAGLPDGGHCLPVRDEGRMTNDQTVTSSFIIRPTGMLRDRSSGYDVLIADELLHQAGRRMLGRGPQAGALRGGDQSHRRRPSFAHAGRRADRCRVRAGGLSGSRWRGVQDAGEPWATSTTASPKPGWRAASR